MEIWQLAQEYLGRDRAMSLVPGRILAIDDDPGNLVVIEELLSDRYQVTTLASSSAALALIREQQFDMIISDQRMPEVTGVQLLQEAARLHPETIRVIVSAYSDARAMLEAINLGGVYRFLLKPWEPEQLESVVKMGMATRLTNLALGCLVEELHQRTVALQEALTKLKTTQERLLLSARLATVGQLSSGIVRELKNQVTGVYFLAQSLSGATVPERLREAVRIGCDSAQSLFDTVSALGSFASGGDIRLKRIGGPVAPVLAEAVRMARLDDRATRRRWEVREEQGLELVFDQAKVRQVVVNLLLNALDATSDGGLISVQTATTGEGEVAITIADDGPGIPDALRPQICEPFFTGRPGRLGLGLAVAQQIVKAHGGRLTFSPGQHGGTVATAVLPVTPPAIGEWK